MGLFCRSWWYHRRILPLLIFYSNRKERSRFAAWATRRRNRTWSGGGVRFDSAATDWTTVNGVHQTSGTLKDSVDFAVERLKTRSMASSISRMPSCWCDPRNDNFPPCRSMGTMSDRLDLCAPQPPPLCFRRCYCTSRINHRNLPG